MDFGDAPDDKQPQTQSVSRFHRAIFTIGLPHMRGHSVAVILHSHSRAGTSPDHDVGSLGRMPHRVFDEIAHQAIKEGWDRHYDLGRLARKFHRVLLQIHIGCEPGGGR